MALPLLRCNLLRLASLAVLVATAGLVQAQEPAAKEYFLGVSCAPLSEGLRDELKTDEKQGLVVMDVIPESPAAVGGVQKSDILVAVGEQELAVVADLIAAVGTAAGNEMKITLVRDGQRQEVTVTPKKRRDINFNMPIPGARAPVGVQIIRPGRMLPPRMALMMHHRDLPDDMSVTISKHGKEPAKIKVEQGDKTWEVTEGTLDELPDNIRPHVEPMVGRLAINLPPGVGDVLTYVPNSEELQQQIGGARREAEKVVAEAREEAEGAARGAEEQGRDLARQARQKAQELRRSAEKAARDTADDAIDRGQRWLDRQLDARFLELDRRIDELRGLVDSLRGTPSPPAPAPDQDEAEKPADKPAESEAEKPQA